MTIHFICRGNVHRSLIAEAYLNSLQQKGITVMSSGYAADKYRTENEPIIQRVKTILAQYGIAQFAKNQAEQLTQDRIDQAEIIVCMNQIVADECSLRFKMPLNTRVWSIDDTGEGRFTHKPGEDEYKFTPVIYRLIKQKINRLVCELLSSSDLHR